MGSPAGKEVQVSDFKAKRAGRAKMCRGRGRGRPMQRERAGSHEERRSDTPKVSCQATTGVRCGARWGQPGRRGSNQMHPGGRAPGGGKRNSMGRRDQVQRGRGKEGRKGAAVMSLFGSEDAPIKVDWRRLHPAVRT